jgi:hypothetical protein
MSVREASVKSVCGTKIFFSQQYPETWFPFVNFVVNYFLIGGLNMAGKARETYDESVTALHQWLQFLDSKELELQAQMERLRSNGKDTAPQTDEQALDKPEAWV